MRFASRNLASDRPRLLRWTYWMASPTEEAFRSRGVTLGREQEVDRLASRIHRPVQEPLLGLSP